MDFLLTMAYQLVDIVLKVDELHKSWRGASVYVGEEGLQLCDLLFRTLVLNESGPIRAHTMQILEKVLL